MASLTRYYVHGDQHEADTDKWYCARHDQFVERDHFRFDDLHKSDGDGDYKRYARMMKSLAYVLEQSRGQFWRPPHAENCIA